MTSRTGLNPFFIRAWVQPAQVIFFFSINELQVGMSSIWQLVKLTISSRAPFIIQRIVNEHRRSVEKQDAARQIGCTVNGMASACQ